MTPKLETNAPAALGQEELRTEFRSLLHEKMRAAIWVCTHELSVTAAS